MRTLQVLSIGMLFAAAVGTAIAAEEPSVTTITVTGKRHELAVERLPPKAVVEAAVVMPIDMPEADIDFQLSLAKPTPERTAP